MGRQCRLLLVTFDVSRFLSDAMSKVAAKPRRPGITELRKNATENGQRPDPVAHRV